MTEQTQPTADPFEDAATEVDIVVRLLREETEALLEVMPHAAARQWSPSPVPRPREDTHERVTGVPTDPTADTALDPRRLAVRETLVRARARLQEAAVAVRGSRLALERSVRRYDGDAA